MKRCILLFWDMSVIYYEDISSSLLDPSPRRKLSLPSVYRHPSFLWFSPVSFSAVVQFPSSSPRAGKYEGLVGSALMHA
jgi:hypothetical protein